MSIYDGKLLIVVSCPGERDTIYIGRAKRYADTLQLLGASMILRYEEVGPGGLTSQPDKATRVRPVTATNGEVLIPLASISNALVADPAAWEGHLGVSRG